MVGDLPAGTCAQDRDRAASHYRAAAVSAALAATVPVTYLVFDVMYTDGRDLLRTPYAQRRALLENLDLAGPDAGVPLTDIATVQ